MFWQNFIRLCTQMGKSPSRVTAELGLTSASAVGWKKGAVPRESTLRLIADYFGVPVESLTADEPPDLPSSLSSGLEPDEVRLLADYRGFSYAGRGLIRDFIEKMKAAGVYAYGVDPFIVGFDSDAYGQ